MDAIPLRSRRRRFGLCIVAVAGLLIGAAACAPPAVIAPGLAHSILKAGAEFTPLSAADEVPDSVCGDLITLAKRAQDRLAQAAAPTAPDSVSTRDAVGRMLACADSVDAARWQGRIALAQPEAVRLAKLPFEIPEYHDEGRLPVGGDRLGPHAGIYASPHLPGFTRLGQITDQGFPGLLVGVVVVQLLHGETIPEAYKAIHLEAGLNCVWLNPQGPGPTYRAYVRPASDTGCVRGDVRQDTWLPVVTVFPADGSEFDDPPAARFDITKKGALVLGFTCLKAFCEIGATPETRREPWTNPSTNKPDRDRDGGALTAQDPTPDARRVRFRKAWHDEQYLADRVGSVWRRTNVRATVIPSTRAASYDRAHFNVWRLVATIDLHDAPTGRYARWGLVRGYNQLWLRFDGQHWVGEIRREGRTARSWRVIQEHVHYDIAVPPLARFRWTHVDDGVWVPCGNACCKADGEGGT